MPASDTIPVHTRRLILQKDRTMSYQMSKNLLESGNILVPVRLPICDRHYKSIPKKPMERSDILHIDDANPERSGIRHVDDDPVSSEERDNQQHSENNDNGEGTVDDFCEDKFHDNNPHDDPNDEEYCPPKNGNEYTELESAVFSLFKAAKIDRGKCTKPFSEYTDRTQKNKARTVLDIMRIIIGVMTKTDEENGVLLAMVIDMLVGKSKDDENAMLHSLLTQTAETFNRLRKHNEKFEILSFFAHSIFYRTMTDYIPNLSERMWNDAKKRAMSPVREKPDLNTRERYKPEKINFFISFITSPHIMVGLPYGEQKTKDSFGNTITLPNTIRLTGIYRTIELYETWMQQSGFEDYILSSSTTYKILSKMPALRSSSQTCVDYFQASATMVVLPVFESELARKYFAQYYSIHNI